MPDINQYTNYREYLKDYYLHKKSGNPNFSYRYIASKVGFKTPGFFSRILTGQKNISQNMILKFSDFLKLKKREVEYFEALVHFNQAKTHENRKHFLNKLMKMKGSKPENISSLHFKFYEKWYYTAIREIINFYPFDGNYNTLAKLTEPTISGAEAKEAVDFLLDNGFIKKNSEGKFKLINKFINAGPDVSPVSIHTFQLTAMDLAKSSLDRIPREDRDVSTLTLSLSQEGFYRVQEILSNARNEMMNVAKADKKMDRVIQVNQQAFPLSKKIGRGDQK